MVILEFYPTFISLQENSLPALTSAFFDYHCGLMDAFLKFSVYDHHSYHFHFYCSNCQKFDQWESLYASSCVLVICPPHCMSISLISDKIHCKLDLYFSAPDLEFSSFYKEPWFLFVANSI